MRVMVQVKADKNSEAGLMPSETLLAEMGAFNQRLVEAGLMLAGEGLHPTAKGVRVTFAETGPTLTKGPFPLGDQGIVCGFWIWNVASMDEAIAWAKRAPFEPGANLEIRPVFETEDFGEAMTPELRAQEERLRAELASRTAH